ncbi:MAG: hypothetical protein H6623_09685 [Bdellovibrionaceae bacterium]|nr:hypothetical protein [Pseudobdellovibrionaceae bacterium]
MKRLLVQLIIIFVPFIAIAGISEQDARTLIQQAKKLYPSAEFVVDEKDPLVVASADIVGEKQQKQVTLSRALLNSPRMSKDGLRLTICHELGHLFGGAPRRNIPMDWPGPMAEDGKSLTSSEGEADYYAPSCLKDWFAKVTILNNSEYDVHSTDYQQAYKVCTEHGFTVAAMQDHCVRSLLAAKNFLTLVADFQVDIRGHDPEVVPQTIIDMYPSRQCRMDTLRARTLCPDPHEKQWDFVMDKKSDCTQIVGQRPACWYQSKAK